MDLKTSIKTMRTVTRKKIKPTTKSNYIGLEIEMISPLSREVIALLLAGEGLVGVVNLGYDSSIENDYGDEPNDGEYGIEARICCKQSEYKSVLAKFLAITKAAGCYINDSCGLHVHLDARNRDLQKMRNNLYACQELLYSVVSYDRRTSQYCLPIDPSTFRPGNRYGINALAYGKHKTIELRMHQGTLNKNDIVNWVDLLLSIVDRPVLTNGWDLLEHTKYPMELKRYINKKVAVNGVCKLRKEHYGY